MPLVLQTLQMWSWERAQRAQLALSARLDGHATNNSIWTTAWLILFAFRDELKGFLKRTVLL